MRSGFEPASIVVMDPDKRPLDLTEATKKDMDLCLLTGIEFLGDAIICDLRGDQALRRDNLH